MKNYIDFLSDKWGPFVPQGHILSNINMTYISDDARLKLFYYNSIRRHGCVELYQIFTL